MAFLLTTVSLPTALGTFQAQLSDAGVRTLRFPNERQAVAAGDDPRASVLADELDAYLRGELVEFAFPVDLHGTPFQLSEIIIDSNNRVGR